VAVLHGVHLPVGKQEVRGLEVLRQPLPDGLLDHPRAGETHPGALLDHQHVAVRRE
jgi:hypothetical protein